MLIRSGDEATLWLDRYREYKGEGFITWDLFEEWEFEAVLAHDNDYRFIAEADFIRCIIKGE